MWLREWWQGAQGEHKIKDWYWSNVGVVRKAVSCYVSNIASCV